MSNARTEVLYGRLGSVIGGFIGLIIALIVINFIALPIGLIVGVVAFTLSIIGGATLGTLRYRQLNKNETKFLESVRITKTLIDQNEDMEGKVQTETRDVSENNIKYLIEKQKQLINDMFDQDLGITVEPAGEGAAEPGAPLDDATPPRPMLNPPNSENNDSSDERGTDPPTSAARKPVDESNKK